MPAMRSYQIPSGYSRSWSDFVACENQVMVDSLFFGRAKVASSTSRGVRNSDPKRGSLVPFDDLENVSECSIVDTSFHATGDRQPLNASTLDLSGRSFTTLQEIGSIHVPPYITHLDISKNFLETIPCLPANILINLDISLNRISSLQSIQQMTHLQELNLGYNCLTDVSCLAHCLELRRLNLTGNRVKSSKGLESLILLQSLDLSDNLIRTVGAVRSLSMCQQLTHLALRGNPFSLELKYRVRVRDTVPSILILDGKTLRTKVRYKAPRGHCLKSLSYSRIYDDRKVFSIRQSMNC
uniref:Uncharacterized protein AlNc14C174G8074 n=1 Tax=Albugo laibachii Nc14 TaxID=890382 RepID=F0WNR2_9STRA|nr:conserved hypothetical protein [Albugo laibachii Nc14]|eukprot:CCA22954.1 conserved hypothetical protein [Albugo laibachii Nc14]